jgi:predicted ribosomally synthesized peptide with SipW-like signal peptide
MKKIIISVSIIAAAAAIVIGATTAYFSDTETSTGNTFTAGSIDLMIDNECYLNGEPVEDCTWELTNLTDELFFDFEDLKPGDNGEDTVGLHVDNNDAWACVTFKNLENNDNTCTEPEDADDLPLFVGCGTDPGAGELAQNLYFVFWADDGDNILEAGEPILMEGPASNILAGRTYPIADKNFSIAGNPGTPLEGNTTYYIGKAWCFGAMTIGPGGGVITCNGAAVNNASQSDSLKGDIEFYAVQARNNPNFKCVP